MEVKTLILMAVCIGMISSHTGNIPKQMFQDKVCKNQWPVNVADDQHTTAIVNVLSIIGCRDVLIEH